MYLLFKNIISLNNNNYKLIKQQIKNNITTNNNDTNLLKCIVINI